MQHISSGEHADDNKALDIVDNIRSWIGLPVEEYTANVILLAKQLDEIDAQAETSMLSTLLNENVTEYFADGMYARELKIPAGVAIISRIHLSEGISILSEGTIAVMDRESYKELSAPYTYISDAGTQRIGLTLTPCTWVSLFKADKQEGVDMIDVVTVTTLEEYTRRKTCQQDSVQQRG